MSFCESTYNTHQGYTLCGYIMKSTWVVWARAQTLHIKHCIIVVFSICSCQHPHWLHQKLWWLSSILTTVFALSPVSLASVITKFTCHGSKSQRILPRCCELDWAKTNSSKLISTKAKKGFGLRPVVIWSIAFKNTLSLKDLQECIGIRCSHTGISPCQKLQSSSKTLCSTHDVHVHFLHSNIQCRWDRYMYIVCALAIQHLVHKGGRELCG
jgi:hypothetical protein